jgi:hypothetical protein
MRATIKIEPNQNDDASTTSLKLDLGEANRATLGRFPNVASEVVQLGFIEGESHLTSILVRKNTPFLARNHAAEEGRVVSLPGLLGCSVFLNTASEPRLRRHPGKNSLKQPLGSPNRSPL